MLKTLIRRLRTNHETIYQKKKALRFFEGYKRILDVGCGAGEFLKLSPGRIVGLDASHAAIEELEKSGFEVYQGNATNMAFGDGEFDGIYCSHMIEHLYPEQVHSLLREFKRILKKEGVLVIESPTMWGGGREAGFYGDLTHTRPYYPKVLIRYLCGDEYAQHSKDVIGGFDHLRTEWRKAIMSFPDSRFIPDKLKSFSYMIGRYLYQYGIRCFAVTGYRLVLRKRGGV